MPSWPRRRRPARRVLKPAAETFWGGYSGYFADPDGHPWEVAWNPVLDARRRGRVHPAGLTVGPAFRRYFWTLRASGSGKTARAAGFRRPRAPWRSRSVQMKSVNDIRSHFLGYFEKNGHTRVSPRVRWCRGTTRR